MTYSRSSQYPAQMFDLLEAVAAGSTTYVECGSREEAMSERKRWYSFISLLRKEKHPAALQADRIVIRCDGSRLVWEPRIGGKMAAIAAEALARLGKATPTAPSEALRDLALDTSKEQPQKDQLPPMPERLNSYLGKDKK